MVLEVVGNEGCADFLASEHHCIVHDVGRELNVLGLGVVDENIIFHVGLAVGGHDVRDLQAVDLVHHCVEVGIFSLLDDRYSHS